MQSSSVHLINNIFSLKPMTFLCNKLNFPVILIALEINTSFSLAKFSKLSRWFYNSE